MNIGISSGVVVIPATYFYLKNTNKGSAAKVPEKRALIPPTPDQVPRNFFNAKVSDDKNPITKVCNRIFVI